jgi:hypothetical protein
LNGNEHYEAAMKERFLDFLHKLIGYSPGQLSDYRLQQVTDAHEFDSVAEALWEAYQAGYKDGKEAQ